MAPVAGGADVGGGVGAVAGGAVGVTADSGLVAVVLLDFLLQLKTKKEARHKISILYMLYDFVIFLKHINSLKGKEKTL